MKKQIPRMVNQSLKGFAPFATGRMTELFLAHMRSETDGHTHLRIRNRPNIDVIPKDIALFIAFGEIIIVLLW